MVDTCVKIIFCKLKHVFLEDQGINKNQEFQMVLLPFLFSFCEIP